MLPQYADLEYGLDDRDVHDAVLGDFDADDAGRAAHPAEHDDDLHVEFVCDAVCDATAGE